MKTIMIGDRPVGEGHPCYFIAEAGVNHNGSIDMAKRLIDVAAGAGADAVKFQKRTIEDILITEVLRQPYNSPNALGATYGDHRQKLELSENDFHELSAYARNKGITFLASAWDIRSADFIESLGVPAFKMASADLTNLPLLEHVARKGRPMLVSTGMSTMEEVADAVEFIRRHNDQLVLLHCVSNYPCDAASVNLRVMHTLKDAFGVQVGYSGHEKSGWAVSLGAVSLGAVVLERHFTLDRTLPGPDHAASLEPQGLKGLLEGVRTVEAAMGSGEKKISEAEAAVRSRLAKSLVSRCEIPKGMVISLDMLAVKGPGNGIKPRFLPLLCGKVARCDIAEDTLIPAEALEW
ncbi:MAG: N-acetylneuraminate synthase family protein [Chloroflexi bacterium]|nr:N-acetylneuraminate synthase family protein [Chloroflexota bacterium]